MHYNVIKKYSKPIVVFDSSLKAADMNRKWKLAGKRIELINQRGLGLSD